MIRTLAAATAVAALLAACSANSSPPPASPTAADGDNLAACSDGTCEVYVRTGTRIPIETGFSGFTALIVGKVDAGGVAFGGKSECCSVNATDQQPGTTTRLNSLDITTVSISAPTAVLRLKPA